MTNKQTLFISEYLKDFNATRAAIAAGYSEDMAYSIGWENTRKPEIKKAIEEEKARLISKGDAIVYANIKYWMGVRDDDTKPDSARLKASEYLGKYGAMFTEKIEHGGEMKVITLPPNADKL